MLRVVSATLPRQPDVSVMENRIAEWKPRLEAIAAVFVEALG